MIHSTAIVDPSAELGRDVEIGPYAIVGAEVVIGDSTSVGPHSVIRGPCRIGHDNQIFQFASVGEVPQDKKFRGEVTLLEIGNGNVIREFTTIHRGTAQDKGITRIGDDNLFMAYTHVAHDCLVGNGVIMANAASLAGHVEVDDFAILGGFSLVHQFCKIGQYSFSAMGSVINRDILPYVMVGGSPTRPHGINSVGLERRGFSAEAIRQIRKAYKVIYKSGLMLDEATQQIAEMATETPELQRVLDFLNKSGRSIIR